jgi:hypothetical protein
MRNFERKSCLESLQKQVLDKLQQRLQYDGKSEVMERYEEILDKY